MARPQKKGFDYFPFDVDFFRNVKIRITMAKFGEAGVLLYVYLLSLIYSNGYYIEYSEDLIYIAAADLHLKAENVEEIIAFFCNRSLFDNTLFTTQKILTSNGIQKRYQEMVKARAKKNTVTVNKNLWLLNSDETESFITVYSDLDNSENNNNNSMNNCDKSENNTLKESKENKSKINESKATTGSENQNDISLILPCTNGEYAVTQQQLNQLQLTYKAIDVMQSFRKMLDYLKCHPDSQRPLDAIENRILMWLNQDNAAALSKREIEEAIEKSKSVKSEKSADASYDISIFERYDIFE
ncbi:MAG: DUF4373 domain-containing protein [Acutalibacteraceae bacterium]|nr:DUF4373 domain-containing protein [Acutalibacteraceae bacterium]